MGANWKINVKIKFIILIFQVKHAQCFDVALMDDGSVVLASKDYRLYIYRYIQVPPIGL